MLRLQARLSILFVFISLALHAQEIPEIGPDVDGVNAYSAHEEWESDTTEQSQQVSEDEESSLTYEENDIYYHSVPHVCDDGWCWDYWGSYDELCGTGVWLPEGPPLFKQFMADPRQITYSAGWRFNDSALAKNTAPVSFGDTCGLYRWYNPWCIRGVMQIDVEGALWADFEQTEESSPLVNADYYVGFPLTFAVDQWSFRLRGYHISSHIGDEFLLVHRDFDRRNASAEYLDFSTSYQWNKDLRLYGLLGWILRSDKTFPMKKFFFEYGLELYFSSLGFYNKCNNIEGRPYFAVNVLQRAFTNYHLDRTVAVGYEWHKMCGLCRYLRLFAEYHAGFSVEGQFCRLPSSWLAFVVSYGY